MASRSQPPLWHLHYPEREASNSSQDTQNMPYLTAMKSNSSGTSQGSESLQTAHTTRTSWKQSTIQTVLCFSILQFTKSRRSNRSPLSWCLLQKQIYEQNKQTKTHKQGGNKEKKEDFVHCVNQLNSTEKKIQVVIASCKLLHVIKSPSLNH